LIAPKPRAVSHAAVAVVFLLLGALSFSKIQL